MLSAKRKSDSQIVLAYSEQKANGPFTCLQCGDEVILRKGSRVSHFAHAYPLACQNGINEGEAHRRCKLEIYQALVQEPNVRDVALERDLDGVRPDISAIINGFRVAIEVQISSLSLEAILHRTIRYHQLGIYVLWILPWNSNLNAKRYAPKHWEKWIHTAYFGRVYYWIRGITVASIRLEPYLTLIPKKTWYSSSGLRQSGGGYTRRSKRFRKPVRIGTLNLVTDFVPRERDWWEADDLKIPDAKLYMERT